MLGSSGQAAEMAVRSQNGFKNRQQMVQKTVVVEPFLSMPALQVRWAPTGPLGGLARQNCRRQLAGHLL